MKARTQTKERRSMKKEPLYSDAPKELKEALNTARIIDDFLPPPELLVPREQSRKVTIMLSQKSIDFFKRVSDKTHVPYQQMIRKVLDHYADHFMK
jgi:predicted DNA binding CopG/RHH family protein